jgi:hypothetical protein
MSKVNQPYDLLEDTRYLKTIIEDNHALNHNDYRPLEEFDKVMRQFGRDMLRNYLARKYEGTRSPVEIEDEIRGFELLIYGTSLKTMENDKGEA